MSQKDCKHHLKALSVMQFLLDEIKQDCATEGWRKGYNGSNGKKPVLDRLTEIRRLALDLGNKIKGEW